MKKTATNAFSRLLFLVAVFSVASLAHASTFGQNDSSVQTMHFQSMSSTATTSPYSFPIQSVSYYLTPDTGVYDADGQAFYLVDQTTTLLACYFVIPFSAGGLQTVTGPQLNADLQQGNGQSLHPCGTYSVIAGHSYTIQLQGFNIATVTARYATSLGSSSATTDVYWQVSNVPAGDGNTQTHVIRITQPALYATTTTPTTLGFDIYNTGSANGYRVDYVNQSTYALITQFGFLADSGYTSPADDNSPYHISTSTPALSSGAYKVTVQLDEQNFDPLPSATNPQGYFGAPDASYFATGTTTNPFVWTPTFSSSSFSYASSSCAINFTGSFSLSDCLGYIFLPSANWITSYQALPATFENVFPFSYPASIATVWTGLQASSTANAPKYTLGFASLGIGSTTAIGNFLPSFDVFSTTTVEKFMPAGTLVTLLSLFSISLWLGWAYYVWRRVNGIINHV